MIAMFLKILVGLALVVCIVRLIIQGLVALAAAVAAGFMAILPVLLWSLAGLAAVVVCGLAVKAYGRRASRRSVALRTSPRIRPTSPAPRVTAASFGGPVAQLGDVETSTSRGKASSPGPTTTLEPQGLDQSYWLELMAHIATSASVEDPVGAPLSSDRTQVSGNDPGLCPDPGDSRGIPFLLIQRSDAVVVGDNNHLIVLFAVRIERPRIDLKAMFDKPAVKEWLRAVRDPAGHDLDNLRREAEREMCAGRLWPLGRSVIDLNDTSLSASVVQLAGSLGLPGGTVIIQNCGLAMVGDNSTMHATINYAFPGSRIDAPQLFSENPEIARLLLDAVIEGSSARRTARVASELDKTLAQSESLQAVMEANRVSIPDPIVDTGISDATTVMVGINHSFDASVGLPSLTSAAEVIVGEALDHGRDRDDAPYNVHYLDAVVPQYTDADRQEMLERARALRDQNTPQRDTRNQDPPSRSSCFGRGI